MASPDYFVYDGDVGVPRRRPSTDDVGGYLKEDDQEYPPDPVTMMTADDMNQWTRLLAGYAKVLPVAVISVTFAAGVPSIAYFNSIASDLLAGDITVTDNNDGDTSLTWTAGKFPTLNAYAGGLTLNDDQTIDEHMAIPIANGVQVITESGGAGTDCDFTVYIHG